MPASPEWVFEPIGPMGGATGNAFVNLLQGGGISPEAQLAREAIQNSCDAAREGVRKVRVVFRIVTLEGQKKAKFLAKLGFDDRIANRFKTAGLAPDNCLVTSKSSLDLLYIEDYETVGLTGDPHDHKSNFHRLLLSIGDTDKLFASFRGGSYGYGKSAVSMNSRLRTIVAYSAFEEDCTGATARLMACAYLPPHEFQKRNWTGRAWFGSLEQTAPPVVTPLGDEDAHAFAEALGFKSRRNGEFGTSILIVDCNAKDHERLREGIEDWWWPRLVDEELEVEIEAAGQKHFPQPKRREHLQPYIECYRVALQTSEPSPPLVRKQLRPLHGLALGACGLQLLPSDQAQKLPEHRLGCVAMIRAPKMVVEYAQLGPAMPPVVGTFVADRAIDHILKLSEPPTHDRWDPESRRLEDAQPDEEKAREIIRKVRERLKQYVREHQADARPPRPKEDRRLESLERELGALLSASPRVESEVGGQTGPVEIHFIDGPKPEYAGDKRLRTTAKIALRLRDDAERDTMPVTVGVSVLLLEGEQETEGDPVPVAIESDEQSPSHAKTEQKFTARVSKSERFVFGIRTHPYERSWSTRVYIEVKPQEEGT